MFSPQVHQMPTKFSPGGNAVPRGMHPQIMGGHWTASGAVNPVCNKEVFNDQPREKKQHGAYVHTQRYSGI
jgi:hypothetical protein